MPFEDRVNISLCNPVMIQYSYTYSWLPEYYMVFTIFSTIFIHQNFYRFVAIKNENTGQIANITFIKFLFPITSLFVSIWNNMSIQCLTTKTKGLEQRIQDSNSQKKNQLYKEQFIHTSFFFGYKWFPTIFVIFK